MSADAKIWKVEPNQWAGWRGIHDSTCTHPLFQKDGVHSQYELTDLLNSIEACENKERPMRWEFRHYPGGELGLVGYCT